MTMGYTRSPQIDSRPFGGVSTFSDPASLPTGDRPPAPASGEEHAVASATADDACARFLLGRCLGLCCSGHRALRLGPPPRPDAAAGRARQQRAALAHSRAPL